MTFGEKVRLLRKGNNMSQKEVADELGITVRAYQNYELKNVLPRKRAIMDKLCELFKVTTGQLFGDEDLFFINVRERYGTQSAKKAQVILSEAQAYLAGGDLSDGEREAFMESFMRMYLESKEISKKKYGKKK
jgi:transcriptional regulator with XRE-family HTH domain